LGIILACVLWGLDNNLTRNISGKDPLVIVAWKGVAAGTFSFLLAFLLGNAMPSFTSIISTMTLGFVSYGLSTILFILSMRGLGAARTSALYGTAPLAGVILSIVIFSESPSFAYSLAGILMIVGALLLVNEEHSHSHVHTTLFHEHSHRHDDPAHAHDDPVAGTHSHEHEHRAEEHEHDHMPDIHHRHGHEE
jgi:drug/metabolite transporter (DMT)-like permease